MSWIAKWGMLVAWMLASPVFAGTSKLLSEAQLKEALKKEPPCCVIDARSEAKRKQFPVAFSIVYSTSIQPKAGGYALVIGDSDDQALEAAKAISRRSGEDVHAVKGGYAAWQRLQSGGGTTDRAPATSMPQQFTIPSNTCEQGTALQEYK
ncbi:rhodanese-like domain-containing protein [Herbaspirillum sp. HC18]|nr:rhodanese-like domain-containing protein [Herbaspirillum sp. HC18]